MLIAKRAYYNMNHFENFQIKCNSVQVRTSQEKFSLFKSHIFFEEHYSIMRKLLRAQNMASFRYSMFIVLCISIESIDCTLYSNWQNLINASIVLKENFNNLYFKRIYESANISQECVTSISDTFKSLNNFEDWSYQMYNSWGSFPPKGILEGTVTDFGDYDQCLSITSNEVIGESQYCLIDISLPVPKPMPKHQNLYHKVDVLPAFVNKNGSNVFVKFSEDASYFYWYYLRLGICTPKKCTENDVIILARKSK